MAPATTGRYGLAHVPDGELDELLAGASVAGALPFVVSCEGSGADASGLLPRLHASMERTNMPPAIK